MEPKPAPRRVLVVDDDPAMVRLETGILIRAGFIVESVSTGEEAIEVLRRTAYDAVSLDIGLPGMDGFEVARQLRGHEGPNRHIPIIMVTATHEQQAVHRGFEVGAVMFLKKPFTAAALRSAVESVIG